MKEEPSYELIKKLVDRHEKRRDEKILRVYDLNPVIDHQWDCPRDHPAGDHPSNTDHQEEGRQTAVKFVADTGDHLRPRISDPLRGDGRDKRRCDIVSGYSLG